MSFLDELFSHAKEVYGTLSHNERIKERSRAYRDSVKNAGIPGIRYLDSGSRGADGGTYNYVVFDDQIPRIVKRNGSFLGLFPEGY